MSMKKVAIWMGQAAAYGFGVGAAVAGVGRLAGYVTNKVKNRKRMWHKGYDAGYDDAKTMMHTQVAELEKQLKENNDLLAKVLQQSEAAE